jgi:hypothetical protein
VGVLYDTADGFTTDGFPQFSAHLARSQNGGSSFSDETIEAFTSPDKTDPSDPRQRELGDYQQLKSVGQTFYGTFSGNRLGFGSSISAIDPIFFQGQAASCAPGQASHRLTANTNVGTINGLFCVNPSTGIGTYTQFPHGSQGSVSGTGIVHQITGGTQIQAFGNNLILGGQRFGTTNQFSETAPVRAIGTYSLS